MNEIVRIWAAKVAATTAVRTSIVTTPPLHPLCGSPSCSWFAHDGCKGHPNLGVGQSRFAESPDRHAENRRRLRTEIELRMLLPFDVHEGTVPAARLDHGVTLQQAVGFCHRVGIDLQIRRQLADGRQRRARLQVAAPHCLANLVDQLGEHRHGVGDGEWNTHAVALFELYVLIVHIVHTICKSFGYARLAMRTLTSHRVSILVAALSLST